MSKVKDETKLQIPLKLDQTKDGVIFEILKACDNRSDFIKDAVFYYIAKIESGSVINRNYPANKVNIHMDIIPQEEKIQTKHVDIQPIVEEIEEYEEENDFEDDNLDIDF